jgi:hypothetical protein
MSRLNASRRHSIGLLRLPRFADGTGGSVFHAAAVFRGDVSVPTKVRKTRWAPTIRGRASSLTAEGSGLFASYAPLGAAAHPPALVAPTPVA